MNAEATKSRSLPGPDTVFGGLLRRLSGVKPSPLPARWLCVCPLPDHDGDAFAASVWQDADGSIGFDCQAGCGAFELNEWLHPEARSDEPPPERQGNGCEVTIESLEHVRPKAIRYLWRDRIPLGKLTIVDGDPGTGKTTAMLDVAARLTTGQPMPGESVATMPPSNVIVISIEDDAADTLVPRLRAAGADLRRVHVIRVRDCGREVMPYLDRYLPQIEQAIVEKGAKLLIIDPLMALLGKVDGHKDQEVRQVLGPLKETTERTGCAVAAIRHLNKAGIGPALYRGGGSIGLAGASRSVLAVGRDPHNPKVRVLAVTKSNTVEVTEVPSLTFELSPEIVLDDKGEPFEDDDGTRVMATRVRWTGTSTLSADQLVSANSAEALENQGAENEAISFLREALASGARPSVEVEKEAKEAGIKQRTLERARQKLGVVAVRPQVKGDRWRISLPARRDREREAEDAA